MMDTGGVPAAKDLLPSSSPAFSTPLPPIRVAKVPEATKPSVLPIILPPATLRPLAFRTITKKHNLTLTSSALQLFATFIGKHCGSGWREEGLAEKVLDQAAKIWKKQGGGIIVDGNGDELKEVLRNLDASVSAERSLQRNGFESRHGGSTFGDTSSKELTAAVAEKHGSLVRNDSLGLSALSVGEPEAHNEEEAKDPRQWIKMVGAFDQPRLIYNVNQKHFDLLSTSPSFLPDHHQRTQLFRQRYNLILQRLLRNASFQVSAVTTARSNPLQLSSSTTAPAAQSYKLTPIANMLGRSGSNHLLLGLLITSPTGQLTINDLTGGIALDIQHARPTPEDGVWFTPGMIVLVDGMYQEEGSGVESTLEGNAGVGGTIGGKFIAFSIGGPPCERREITLGASGAGEAGHLMSGGGFGWVDFLGVGSERATGPAMRKLENDIFRRGNAQVANEGRARMIILGEVHLDNAKTLQALKKVLGLYAAESAEQTPMVMIFMGDFVRHAVMTGGGSGGSIEYKECFDSLASIMSDYPTLLQSTKFVFVPGDNDPWASAFSAGAASVLPKSGVPELFTSRIKRTFVAANTEAERSLGTRTGGEAIWTTNPSRLTMFGPAQEIVLFRDGLLGRLRRNAVRFRPLEKEPIVSTNGIVPDDPNTSPNTDGEHHPCEGDVDEAVESAESQLPAPQAKTSGGSLGSPDLRTARKLVKTILDQGYLSPFPLSIRPTLWDYTASLQLYPLPTAMVLMDPEAPPYAIGYEGCHVMNPGPLVSPGKRDVAQWIEYDARTRRGRTREARY